MYIHLFFYYFCIMLNLEKHISELLYQYDCVIVPNLGGFVANNIAAQINEETGIFNPPVREIGFNRSLSYNDGLLINHIAKCEGISYEDCQDKILKHVNILKFQMSRGEELKIDNVGILKADTLGNTMFVSNKDHSFSIDSFGLSTFHFNTLEQDIEQKDNTRHLVRQTLHSKSVRQIAASVALIVGLLFVTPNINYQQQQSSFTNLFTGNDIPVLNVPVTIHSNTSEIGVEQATVSKQILETNAPIENNFFIIGGSFKLRKPAEEFVIRMQKKGFENIEILNSNKGRYRVALSAFTNKNDAVVALKEFRNKNGFKSAWLLTK